MGPSSRITDEIRSRIESAMRGACGEDAAIVRATQGLPVYKSLGGCLALRPDGEVALFGWDGEGVTVMGAEPDDAEWIGVRM